MIYAIMLNLFELLRIGDGCIWISI